jgi:hypothetical protein
MRHAEIETLMKGLSIDSHRHQVPPPVPKVERPRAAA